MSKKIWMILLVSFPVVLIAAGWVAVNAISGGDKQTEPELIAAMEARYNGEVMDIHDRDPWVLELHNQHGVYEITVDQDNGRMIGMAKLSQDSAYEPDEDTTGQLYGFDEINRLVEEEFGSGVEILESRFMDEDPPYYELTIRNGDQTGELEMDALTGDIRLYTVRESEPIEPISREEAMQIALEAHPGEVDDVDLEEQDGRLVYEIDIENEETEVDAEIILDAYSGEILSIELD